MAEDRMLERVRKLLAQAEDPSVTQAEAEAFTERAAQLMARHGIDQALIDARRDTGQREQATHRTYPVHKPYAIDKSVLAFGLADALGCKAVRTKVHGRDVGYRMTVFGMPTDLDRFEILWTSLLVQAARQLAHVQPDQWGESTAAYRRTWLAGFTRTVCNRVAAAERSAHTDAEQATNDGGPSVALVLADRSTLVQHAQREMFPRLRTAPARRLSGSGYGDGRAAGQRADIGHSRIGSNRAALAR